MHRFLAAQLSGGISLALSLPPTSMAEPGAGASAGARHGVGGKFTVAGGPIPMLALQVDWPGRWSFHGGAGAMYTGIGAITRSELNLRTAFWPGSRWEPNLQTGVGHVWLSESNISDGSLHIVEVHATLGLSYRKYSPWIFSGELGAFYAPDAINSERDEEEDLLPIGPILALEVSYLF